MSETHPVAGIEIREEVPLRHAMTASELASLFGRLRRKEIPVFHVAPTVVTELEAGGRDAFDVLTERHGFEAKAPDQRIGTEHNPWDPLHTDKPHLIPDGADTRFHQIESDHASTISVGRLTDHDGSIGTEYVQGHEGGSKIDEMHVGEVERGGITVFELSGDVAHRFSSPGSGQKRDSRIRSVGPKTTS